MTVNLNRRWLVAGGLVLALVVGYGAGSAKIPDEVEVLVPSPYEVIVPSPYEVLVPSPYPVAEEACMEAIDIQAVEILDLLNFVTDLLGDYLNYPDENLTDFGGRVEQRLLDLDPPSDAETNALMDLIDECELASQ